MERAAVEVQHHLGPAPTQLGEGAARSALLGRAILRAISGNLDVPGGEPLGNPYDEAQYAWYENVGFDRLIDHPLRTRESVNAAETPLVSNNSAHRNTPDVPMMVPEINPEHAAVIELQRKRLGVKRGFIAVKPNCSLQSYVPAIHPLMKFGPRQIAGASRSTRKPREISFTP